MTTGAMPRVLHVIGAMNVGGAETMLMNLYRSIDRRRVQFDFLVFGNDRGVFDGEVEEMGGRILRVPQPRERGLLRAVADIRKILRRHGPYRAVHAHILHASAVSMLAAEREHVPIRVTHSHNTGDVTGGALRQMYTSWSRRAICKHSTQLVACGSDAGRYLFGPGRTWALLRNGVDLDRFWPPDPRTRADARCALGISEGQLVLGSVARFETVKNHDFVIGIAEQLRGEGVDFQMLLAGDGSRRQELARAVQRAGLEGQVRFLGLRRDVPTVLASMDGLLMPSLYEGIPVALVEAQATGLPCFVSQAVSREVDLGVGLIDFLPLDDVQPWVDRVIGAKDRRVSSETLAAQLRRAGADIRSGVDTLYDIYGLEASP
jgi:glycosyltransferase EpsF